MSEAAAAWTTDVRALLARQGRRGNFIVELPEYRPDLALKLAHDLGWGFLDFRREVMAELGWEAHRLSPEDLDRTLRERAGREPVVAFNVEALLATEEPAARRRWFREYLERDWSHPVVVPITVYGDAVDRSSPRYHAVAADELATQSFVDRLVW